MSKQDLMPTPEELKQIRYREEPSASVVLEACIEWIQQKSSIQEAGDIFYDACRRSKNASEFKSNMIQIGFPFSLQPYNGRVLYESSMKATKGYFARAKQSLGG